MSKKTETGKASFHQQKGFGQDQVFLLIGILILVITAYVIYTLIGGPYCDDLAKRTANNIKVAVDNVATTGTYTKDSPYTTYAMLCQTKVGSPLTLNPVKYRAFSTPEYMIYWEHFPESPTNLAEGLYKFDESYPFTKNFAQIAGLNIGLSVFSGTLSAISKTKIGGVAKDFASKISKDTAGKVGSVFLPKTLADIAGKPITVAAKGIKYMKDYISKGSKKAVKFIVDSTGISEFVGKYITAKTSPRLFGRVTGVGFLNAMADNGLVETTEIAGEEGLEAAVRMVRVANPEEPGKFVKKAIVSSGKREKLKETVADLTKSSVQEEKEMGNALKRVFAYEESEISAGEAVDISTTTFRKIVLDSETENKGFYELTNGAMDAASKSFDESSKVMAAKSGLYAHRPITVFFDQSGITRFSNKIDAKVVFGKMKFFDSEGNLVPEIADGIKKSFKELSIATELKTPDQFSEATEKFFVKDGKAIVAGAETDTSMMTFLESQVKAAKDGPGTGVTEGAYKRFIEGKATSGDITSIAAALKKSYREELEQAGVQKDLLDSMDKKLDLIQEKFDEPNYMKRLVRDYGIELKSAKQITGDTDEAGEIAMLSASWKREPEQLALMTEDKYDFLPYQIYNDLGGWQAKGTKKFLKLNLEAYAVSDVENDLKYSYLKSPNAGCESNTVCLNQKGVEQKKSDVAEEQIKDYETVYVVSKSVNLKLKRDGFTSPLGAGVGAFKFEKNPRFHIVSPCLAEISFYQNGSENGKPVVMADVQKCQTPGHSNYCYFPEKKFNEMAEGFYGSLVCSVIADFGKIALVGFLLQPACSSIEVWTEYDTTWPFRPFESLKNTDMNIAQCNIEKNPKDAAKLAMRACCGISKCTGDFVCSGVDYADKNLLMCGADKCKLEDLAKATGEDYKQVCGCQ